MPILDGQSYANVQEKNPLHHTNSLFSHVILTRDNDIFKNQSEDTRRTKMRIHVCYAGIGWSVLRKCPRKESFASHNLPIFICYSYERLRSVSKINQRILEGQKCGYTFVRPILDRQSYANVQEKSPLHHKTSLFSHVILTKDYDFFQKSIREYAKGKNVHKRLICQYWMVSLTQMFKKRILCITQFLYFHMLFLREITIFSRNQSENT